MSKRREARCDWCKGPGPLHRHHLTYKRYKRELREDYVYICQLCHGDQHPDSVYLPHAHDRKLVKLVVAKAKRRSVARLKKAENRLAQKRYRRKKLSRKEWNNQFVDRLVRQGWKRIEP